MRDEQNLIVLIDDDSICNVLNKALIKKSGLESDVRTFENPSGTLEFLSSEIREKKITGIY